MDKSLSNLSVAGRYRLTGVPSGLDALILAEVIASGRESAPGGLIYVADNDVRLAAMADALGFFAPEVNLLRFPAWDCLPYDRASPNTAIVAERAAALTRLASAALDEAPPPVLLTTINALLQRVPPRSAFGGKRLEINRGGKLDSGVLTGFLTQNGYLRVDTVREPGEFAFRGGIIDLFPAGSEDPVRIDLFGDAVEDIRSFDPISQRSGSALPTVSLEPVAEAHLDNDSIARFRAGYRELFGSVADDQLYTAISEGRHQPGWEHWLPLFYDELETIFDYLPGAAVMLDHGIEEAREARFESIADYFDARMTMLNSTTPRPEGLGDGGLYRPLDPARLYLTETEWEAQLKSRAVGAFSPFSEPGNGEKPDQSGEVHRLDFDGRKVHDFAASRAKAKTDNDLEGSVFDSVCEHLNRQIGRGKRGVVTASSTGARARLSELLRTHGLNEQTNVDSWADAQALPAGNVAMAVIALEHGFTDPRIVLVSEQDILGDKLVRSSRKRKKAEAFITDMSELGTGDLVVHIDHGIGRYDGLEALDVSGAPHDCLRISYYDGDRLFVPVENIELLSRYGRADTEAPLDRLGGAAWQGRKARVRKRLKDMADQLIGLAASRAVRPAVKLVADHGAADGFAAAFPYDETEDQAAAIAETLADLEAGRPMDRLICGDVGFGKTEVALRAAFTAVSGGAQVALVVPTTLLARQHAAVFTERFSDASARVAQLSRLVTGKAADAVRSGIADGSVDIVIGTHALLGKEVKFSNLGLLIIDEEQHFGVAHKEKLKQLKADVHVLTLTATPIPRTLQLALTGVRQLSLIATPPVDRLAVRTFILPYDSVVVREAIMREHFRGGQIYYVCPRIADIEPLAEQLRSLVPELKFAIAHGRLSPRELEDVMTAFYDGTYDLLLSTQIIEAGIDLPRANTLIIHRADRFGLAQLYQLRGRVGRSKLRGYAYFTVPARDPLTDAARRRLEVLQSLDTLGAGFSLASHDLDIRGAGNLLGEEQSGHIKEVGSELYQQLLEEAVATAREGSEATVDEAHDWSPEINLGLPVLIPEHYVEDLGVRLGLYRRLAALEDQASIEGFAAEMIDRFGPLPGEVETLLTLVEIKRLCRQAHIEKYDAGPRGAMLSFRDNLFGNPAGLVTFISEESGRAKLRPDHKMVFRRDWTGPQRRVDGSKELLRKLAAITSA